MPQAKLDAVRPPRTQQQRREQTRRALLDAAVESLIEVGFARTTTLEVQHRANVFPSLSAPCTYKTRSVSVAAVPRRVTSRGFACYKKLLPFSAPYCGPAPAATV